jgi:hypothetical protein
MSTDETRNLSGLLLEYPGGNLLRSSVLQCGALHYRDLIPQSKWEVYVYRSSTPLRGEEQFGARPPYDYPVVLRRSGARVLLLAGNREITHHMMAGEFGSSFSPRLVVVSIAVDELVRRLSQKPTMYVLSFVHARIPAFGASLRSVSFYGDDLAEASLFRGNVELMTFFTCGLRRAVGGPELVRLGSDGTVSFYMTDDRRVLEVEEVLSFLRQEGYLASSILGD